MADSGGCGCLIAIVVVVLISSASDSCSSSKKKMNIPFFNPGDGTIWREIYGRDAPYRDQLKKIKVDKK